MDMEINFQMDDSFKQQLESLVNYRLQDLKNQPSLNLSDINCPKRPNYGNTVNLVFLRTIRLIAMRETLGHRLSGAILYTSGYKLASQSRVSSLQDLTSFLSRLMVGKTRVVRFDAEGAIFEEDECGICSGLPKINEPVCFFEAGFIAGALEQITRKDTIVRESKCWGLGDRVCRFEAEFFPQGTISAEQKSIFHDDTSDPIELIISLTAKAAMAFDLVKELERRNEELNRELALAQNVQKRLLPQELPQISGMDLLVHYQPYFNLSGDFYDFIQLKENRLGIFLSDVTGHGVSAAMVTTILKTMLTAHQSSLNSPQRLIQILDKEIQMTIPDTILSAIYLVVDFSKKTISYSNAGHPAAILISNETGEISFLKGNYSLIGVFNPSFPCPVKRRGIDHVPYGSGDILLLYTDGVYEILNEAGEVFGYERFIEIVKKYATEDINAIDQGIAATIENFRGCRELNDDFCLIAIKLP